MRAAASRVTSADDGFTGRSLARLIVDGQLTSPTIQLARHHAAAPRAAATFLYSFGPRRRVTLADAVDPVDFDDGPLEYLLGAPLVDGAVSPFGAVSGVYTHWQKVVCAMMLHYWTNFITTGYVGTTCSSTQHTAVGIERYRGIDIEKYLITYCDCF